MQVDVSMYLDTVGTTRSPERLPTTEAEERRISRPCTLMPFLPSRLLELDEERFVFRRPSVGVHRRWRRCVREGAPMLLGTRKAPVKGEPDVPHLLAVDRHRAEPLGHHRDALNRAARARDLDSRSVVDSLLLGETFGDLDEETGLELVQNTVRLMAGPVMELLGQAVSRHGDGKVLLLAVDVLVCGELLGDWVGRHLGVERVDDGRLDGLVVLGERAVVQRRGEKAAQALRQHDEGAEGSRRRVRLDVGYVPDPFLAVPPDSGTRGIPGFPLGVR